MTPTEYRVLVAGDSYRLVLGCTHERQTLAGLLLMPGGAADLSIADTTVNIGPAFVDSRALSHTPCKSTTSFLSGQQVLLVLHLVDTVNQRVSVPHPRLHS